MVADVLKQQKLSQIKVITPKIIPKISALSRGVASLRNSIV